MPHSTPSTLNSFPYTSHPPSRQSTEMPSAQCSGELGHRSSSPILSDPRWDCLPPTVARTWSKATYRTKATNRHLHPTVPFSVHSSQFQRDHTALPISRWPTILPSRTRASLSELTPESSSERMGYYPGIHVSRKRTTRHRALGNWSTLPNPQSCI